MPAPRSVLIDIHDRGLNPQVAHKSVDSGGRIKGSVVTDEKPAPTPEVAKETPVKTGKNTSHKDVTTTVASGEVTAEVVSNEGAGSVEHKQQEEAVVETPATSRRKRHTPSNA